MRAAAGRDASIAEVLQVARLFQQTARFYLLKGAIGIGEHIRSPRQRQHNTLDRRALHK